LTTETQNGNKKQKLVQMRLTMSRPFSPFPACIHLRLLVHLKLIQQHTLEVSAFH
jgi:hypothetical protein